MTHPIQPIELDKSGVARFRSNTIVQYLLDHGGIDLNKISCLGGVPREDRVQFAQLIGYSLDGFSTLSYVSAEDIAAADRMHESGKDEKDARIETLTETIRAAREGMRDAVAELYGIHPDNLRTE